MINKNTQQTTQISSGIKSESTIYLKKSELPKDISSFRNDVGYISTSALGVWMKEHSYLTKSEINTLIKNANLVVVDSINKSMDDDAISRLNDDITNIKGEIVAIKDRLTDLDIEFIPSSKESKFATKSELNTLSGRVSEIARLIPDDIDTSYFATKDEIPTKVSDLENDAHYLTEHQSLAKYAKKSEIPDVSGFITIDDVPSTEGLASEEWVNSQGFLKEHQSLVKYAKKSEIPDVSNFVTKDEIPSIDGIASEEWVNSQGFLKEHQSLAKYAKKSEIPDVSNFVTKDEIPSIDGIASEEWVNSQGFLKEHQSLAKYAKKSEIPSLDGYATQTWVEEQGYLKEIGNDYAKKSDLDGFVSKTSLSGTLGDYAKKNSVYNKTQIDNTFLSKEDASGIYPTKEYVDETYLSNLEAAKNYLKIEDYRGLKDATVINTDFREKTLEELSDTLESSYLRNGFYIVHYNDIVIIKDNKIVQMFKDGVPQTVIEWEVEE